MCAPGARGKERTSVTDTESIAAPATQSDTRPRTSRRGAGLSGMVLTELRGLASELGIKGVSGMRKGDLVSAIEAKQVPASAAATEAPSRAPRVSRSAPAATSDAPSAGVSDAVAPRDSGADGASAGASSSDAGTPSADTSGSDGAASDGANPDGPRRTRNRRGATRRAGAAESTDTAAESQNDAAPTQDGRAHQSTDAAASTTTAPAETTRTDGGDDRDQGDGDRQNGDRPRRERQGRNQGDRNQGDRNDRNQGDRNQGDRNDRNQGDRNDRNQGDRNDRNQGDRNDRNQGDRNQGDRNDRNQGDRNQGDRNNGPRDNGPRDDEDGEGRGRRGRRFRERRRGRDRDGAPEGGGNQRDREREPELRDDDVVQPVAGILDVLDNYAFVRTSGYLAGPNDVYVSMNMVRRNGLRRGDALTGAVRVAREGEQNNSRQKFNPLVRLDTVNGAPPDGNRKRPEFNKLTPLYPNQRLRLETTQNILTTRVIDLVMPIGKGQRALIVSPPKAGKTSVLQAIANAIATNNPECYLMVVLVDERPEEVTDMQRSVKGEVIASTFDRPPGDHTSVAELAIERAKRLVEDGRDVVVLLDSITRLGRAYNNSSPASGRILSGGVDSTALYPPKRFLGAARNIENGGSLTIIATAMVETGSTGDTVIFEEFKGTGNAELKLDRKIAERRVFPAVDVNPSGTRKDELLLSPDEAAVLHKLRRVLSGLDSHQAIDLLIDRLKKSKNNIEFLMSVSKTAPGSPED
ncbi:transcription termination factor Rho [Rhodococcus sp. BP-149]|nr:transcription termination factor Rho [Rhodococcus sp. BP-288]MBY6694160.1 transcription termination factor Rho [Rhodococcus sp. BP-188]MBY6697869.1 transcription termination factor Rho [Rhodococcus sp. BP-285]MBY6704089.1 transcription termination factor Rho [Rhodococcus sp. BP-283]MBY6712738.1 transcription termination factor Rho [Rhodococcus sp. BP-160]MBY6714082.1 transcription termination factor Rho [Rhodococcus sp. BP-110]MBY6720712.1 transcription termination factor Rho [Rhodococcus 